jgi:hypothetical protein
VHHPSEGFDYPGCVSHARTGGPKNERFVAVANVADMLGLVFVDGGFGISEPDALADLLDVRRFACEEGPTRSGVPTFPVVPDYIHGIFLRLQCDRVHKELPADLVTEQLLDFRQVGRDHRADFVALRVKEVEADDLVLDQVIVEADFIALVRDQGDIRQMEFLDSPASERLGLFHAARSLGSCPGSRDAPSHGRDCGQAEQVPS